MKHLLFLLFTISCLSTGCNNKKNKTAPQEASATLTTEQTVPGWQQKMEVLQQLTPLTPDEMLALLPAEIAGDSATGREAGSNMGTGFTKAVYGNDSASTEISVFDCGGTAGAGIYQAQYVNQLENQSDNEDEYTKVVDFKGDKAIEHAGKRNNTSSLTYFSSDRFLVIAEGKNRGVNEIKKAAGSLKLK